jgi:hypothetical protein
MTPVLRAEGVHQSAEPVKGVMLKLEVDRTTVALSGHLKLTLSAKGPASLEIDPIGAVVTSNEWEARPGVVVTGKEATKREWRQSFELDPFPLDKDKKLPLMVAPLRYRLDTGDWLEQAWQPLEITVTSTVPVPSIDDAKGITGIEALPPLPIWTAWKVAGLIGLAVFTGIALVAWRLRRRPARAVPEPLPHEWALRELERIEMLDLPGGREIERHHTLISDVLRRYLELRFGLRAPEQTTPEFLAGLRHSTALAAPQQEQLREFLERCDLAKFARAEFNAAECRVAVDMARAFIDQTVKRPEMPVERNGQPAPAR